MVTTRRAAAMVLAPLLIAAALSIVGAPPAGANAYGHLQTSQARCLDVDDFANLFSSSCQRLELYPQQGWHLQIVGYVGDSPRYRVLNGWTGTCLVAFASSGRVALYQCNSNWADQVWGFQFVKVDPVDGLPRFWLRNRHSGRCLALNSSRVPQAFMSACADYRDQLWKAPGT